ncbi:MAG: ABC transporter permease [Oscillospiraceae bacterium]|nr:ABC transporter permease [Oscillospiraceae bacterium]
MTKLECRMQNAEINKLTVFAMTLRRIFKQPLNWAGILAFPIISFILISITASSVNDEQNDFLTQANVYFGVADLDKTLLSETLVTQLGLRYNLVEVNEADITASLTNDEIPWVLLIREGYESEVLRRNTDISTLESYTLSINDISLLGTATAENITRALMILGTNEPAVIEQWQESAKVEFQLTNVGEHWEAIAQWLAMFGFVCMFTAYFVIKTLLDDKRGGMPDRVGVLPISARFYLIQGTAAAFIATEISVGLSLAVLVHLYSGTPHVLLLFLLLSLYNLFSVSLVLTIASFASDLGVISTAIAMIATLSAMLGGLFWPIELVPEFMQKIAWFSPGFWFAEGLRNLQDVSFTGFVVPLLFLFGFTVVVVLIGGVRKVQGVTDN